MFDKLTTVLEGIFDYRLLESEILCYTCHGELRSFCFFAQLNNKLNRAKLTTFFAIPRLPLGGGFLFGFRLPFLPLLLVSDMRLCNKCIVNLHNNREYDFFSLDYSVKKC